MRYAWAIYLATAAVAEVLMPVAPIATAMLDAAVIVAALTHFGLAERSPLAIGDPAVRVLPGVALVPLLRLLSLTLPLPTTTPIYWLAFAMPPTLIAVLAASRLASLDVQEMSLTRYGVDRISAVLVLASGGLGVLLGLIAASPFQWDAQTPVATTLTIAVLVGGAAIPEELVYRGVLQPLLRDLMGAVGIIVVAAVFAASYAGTGSLPFVVGMAVAGLAYSWNQWRCASIWPGVAGHSVLLVTQIIVAPLLH